MRICFLSTIGSHPWGGADFLWTRAAVAAQERGDRLLLGLSAPTTASPRIGALLERGARLQVVPAPAGPASLATRVLNRLRPPAPQPDPVVGALAAFAPDLVVISCGATYDLAYFPQWTDWLAATRTPFRVIANWQSEHPELPAAERARLGAIFPAADALFFVSQRNLEVTRRHLALPLPNARVLHNPLRWTPADVSPFPASPVARLATVSRLDEGKGVHLLLQALKETGAPGGSWQLAIHGRGPQEDELRALTARLGLAANVTFAGHVSDLRAIWAGHQLLCSPAIDDGVPMTIPEAMLCGRPVLATCVGGAEDWLRDNKTGFLSPAPTVPQLADALRRALAAQAQWSAMGREAAAAATAHYRPDDFQHVIAPRA
jgi:glycosyltransferase involved in cell wall biosynthesis